MKPKAVALVGVKGRIINVLTVNKEERIEEK